MNEVNSNYADIDKLIANQNSLLEQQQAQQNDILNQQMQMQIDQINRNKAEIDQNVNKTNSGLYADYKKASNRYGANAENLFTQGLGNSGFAESTQTNLYNTYQKNITDTNNTAMKLKADFDNQIAEAMKNRNLQQAQFALQMYQQKMNLLAQEYDMKNAKEQQLYNRGIDERNYNYQLSRDAVADNQWNQQFDYQKARDTVADNQYREKFDYQKSRDAIGDDQWLKEYLRALEQDKLEEQWRNKNFDYQKSRDSIADSQWERQFALSQASKASKGGSAPKNSGGSPTTTVNQNNNDTQQSAKLGGWQEIRDNVLAGVIYKKISESENDEAKAEQKAKEFLANQMKYYK